MAVNYAAVLLSQMQEVFQNLKCAVRLSTIRFQRMPCFKASQNNKMFSEIAD
jgi:hypothetical protein